ncbi:MAG: nucleotide exchange factor GrpE [Eubacteriales bacterium]|nr:nucleotide exchange factor GrpE [Eubacteriales bacterium]
MQENYQLKTYEEVAALKDLFLRRLMDDKIKASAIIQLKEDIEILKKQLDEKAIYSIVKEILLVCDRIDQQETVDDMTSSIEDELLEILERREFYRMPPSDEFDPLCHNAVGTVEETPDHPEKTVVRVVRSGYYFRDRVFRPADVIVAVKRNDMDYAD